MMIGLLSKWNKFVAKGNEKRRNILRCRESINLFLNREFHKSFFFAEK